MSGAYYNEFDSGAAAWLRELIRRGLIADGEVDERSILDVQPDDLRGFTQCHFFAGIGGWSYALRLAGIPDDMPCWTGSPPCQPFSTAGEQKGKDDERHLAPHFAALVADVRPPILFGEQVASAAVFGRTAKSSRRAAEREPEWAWIDDLQDRLEAAHYAVGASDIPAAGVGAPHIRQRTFFGAVRLADACGEYLRGELGEQIGPKSAAERKAWEWEWGGTDDSRGSSNDRLADSTHEQHNRTWIRREAGWSEHTDSSADDRMADADNEGSQGRFGMFECADQCTLGQNGLADAEPTTSTPHSFWADADWLYCRDGKWRPVEPGTQPLAHGVSARVVRLRGYGNAIVPQAAAAFITAFMESL